MHPRARTQRTESIPKRNGERLSNDKRPNALVALYAGKTQFWTHCARPTSRPTNGGGHPPVSRPSAPITRRALRQSDPAPHDAARPNETPNRPPGNLDLTNPRRLPTFRTISPHRSTANTPRVTVRLMFFASLYARSRRTFQPGHPCNHEGSKTWTLILGLSRETGRPRAANNFKTGRRTRRPENSRPFF